jgi:hypothetical protein
MHNIMPAAVDVAMHNISHGITGEGGRASTDIVFGV